MNPKHFSDEYIDDIAKVSTGKNYFSPVWQEAINLTGKFEKMLDIGCGNGIFSAEAKALTGCTMFGVDGSAYALKQAQTIGFEQLEQIRDFNTDPLPFADAQFDFCLCKDLLEHLLHPQFVLQEAARVLKPQGYLLVHVPNHFTLQGRLRFLFSNNIDTYDYFPGAKRWDFPHIRFYTHESMVELLNLSGFSVVRDLSHNFAVVPGGRLFVPFAGLRQKLASRHPSQFAEGVTLLARKNGGANVAGAA